VSLDSIIYAFRNGYSPEAIARDCFSTLTLEQVYGGLSFYLAHRQEMDAYLIEAEQIAAEIRAQLSPRSAALAAKLAQAKHVRKNGRIT